jgi:hypothetical protein
MGNGPIVTVEQGLEINEWLKEREKQARGTIRSLRHNLDQSKAARLQWQAKCYELRAANLLLRTQPRTIKCRRRLIPVVRFLLDI